MIIFPSYTNTNTNTPKMKPISMKFKFFIFLIALWTLLLLCRFLPAALTTKTPTTITKHLVSDRAHHRHIHHQQNPPTLIQQVLPNPPQPMPIQPNPTTLPISISPNTNQINNNKKPPQRNDSSCSPNSLVYIYDLPPKFNHNLLKDCQHLSPYTNMCPHITHRGLGPSLPIANNATWFATNQFTTELIFHARLENHPCRTHNPKLARLFYVPFYGGFHASRHSQIKNLTARNALIVDLSRHLLQTRWWKRKHGRDHFMALGRTGWDFMRSILSSKEPFGASDLLTFPLIQNMSFLPVERHPWRGANQFAVPYPSYFHPYTSDQLIAWQRHVLTLDRPHLFSFIGSMRRGKSNNALARNEIVRQCQMSSNCTLLDCSVKGEGKRSICYDPARVLGVMTRSKFCLHPPGDSFTRRSIFDSFLAGCVPVFFTKHSAYDQYMWYLPTNGSLYSVLVGSNRRKIEEVLGGISGKVVDEMRKRVVALLPNVTYMHPNGSRWGVRDAVDVALDALSKHVGSKKSVSLV